MPSRSSTRHLWQQRCCWPGGLTPGSPPGRKAWAGVPLNPRGEGLRHVAPKKKFGGYAQQHPAHRPAEGSAQARPALLSPPGGRLLGTPVPVSPTVALLALFASHNARKKYWPQEKYTPCTSPTRQAQIHRHSHPTSLPQLTPPAYTVGKPHRSPPPPPPRMSGSPTAMPTIAQRAPWGHPGST